MPPQFADLLKNNTAAGSRLGTGGCWSGDGRMMVRTEGHLLAAALEPGRPCSLCSEESDIDVVAHHADFASFRGRANIDARVVGAVLVRQNDAGPTGKSLSIGAVLPAGSEVSHGVRLYFSFDLCRLCRSRSQTFVVTTRQSAHRQLDRRGPPPRRQPPSLCASAREFIAFGSPSQRLP